MDNTEKVFNLKTLMTVIVGVISMIVIIPTMAIIMNKVKPETLIQEGYEFRFKANNNNGLTFFMYRQEASAALNDSTYSMSTGGYRIDSIFIYPYLTINIYDLTDMEDNTTDYIQYNDTDTSSLHFGLDGLDEGIYDFTHITGAISEDQVLDPVYTAW